jgi:hypothetical protein
MVLKAVEVAESGLNTFIEEAMAASLKPVESSSTPPSEGNS